MASKSIKNIRDIFEGDNITKTPTFTKYCDDLGPALNINGHQQQDKSTNKSRIPNKIKEPHQNSHNNIKSATNMIHKDAFNLGTVRDRIGKLNQETISSRNSTNSIIRYQKSGTMNNRQPKKNESPAASEKCKRSQTLPTSQRRIRQLNLNNFENIPANQKNNAPSPRTPKSPKSFNSYPSRIALPRKDYRKSNEVGRNDTKSPRSVINILEKKNVSNDKPQKESALPEIPPKPKFINQIKPHPNLPFKSKKALQEKIQIFNNLGNKNGEDNQQVADRNSDRLSSKSQDYDSWKSLIHSKGVQNSESEEDIYDLVVNPDQKQQGETNLKPRLPPKQNVGKESDSYHGVEVKDNKKPLVEPYDVVDISNLNNRRCINPIPEDNEEHVHRNVVNGKTEKNKKCARNPKFAKDKKNLRVMSKDHSLEDEGYVVITNDGNSSSYSESSEEELATEYDVIENLNVTKITVEKRYKVPNNEEEDSTFNVKRETYYDHNLNPRIERISRQVQKGDDTHSDCKKQGASKSFMIIQELVQTELAYFKGLLRVYEDYIVYFKESPPSCSPNITKVFGNFEDIYKLQIEFYAQLTECGQNVDDIADTFLKNVGEVIGPHFFENEDGKAVTVIEARYRNEALFDLYKQYILNKHTSNRYSSGECLEAIKARDIELGNTLNLESFLLTPFQRLIRYRLLLKNLHETLEKENAPNCKLKTVIDYLDDVIESTNLQVKLMQGIQDAPLDLMNFGKLLMVDDCFMRNNGRKYCATVILFEGVIIFTRKTQCDKYIYKGSINLSDLYIRSITEEETSFQLQDFTQYKLKHDNKYVYDVEVRNSKIKQEWMKKIETLLWNQFAAHKRS